MSGFRKAPEPGSEPRVIHTFSARSVLPIALASVTLSAVLLGLFHDRFWYAPDEGAYAYVASRILAGDVLHRDIQDIHAGYINFVNAAAFAVFGENLVSLRYPLVLLGILQAAILLLVMLPAGRLVALTGSLALTSFSFVQFLNPTAHWYSLFLVVLLIAVLTFLPRERASRALLVGFILATLLLFRQLTGVIVSIGALGYLLLEMPRGRRGPGWISPAITATMAAGLTAYAVVLSGGLTAFLYAGPAILVLARQATKVRGSDIDVLRLSGNLSIGAFAGLMPITLYHLGHGSLGAWYTDSVVAAARLPGLDFVDDPSILAFSVAGLARALTPANLAMVLNGLFWAVLPLLPVALGIAVLRAVFRDGIVHPLPYLAVFYTVVSLHYEIPIYLFYTIGLTIAALLYLTAQAPYWRLRGVCGVVLLSAVAVCYQAAQPPSRGGIGVLSGERVPTVRAERLEKADLRIPFEEEELYTDLVQLILRETTDGETILALPSNPELYFLSGRRSALPFFNSAHGIQGPEALSAAIDELKSDPPRLVFHVPEDKYNNFASAGLMEFVAARYESVGHYGNIAVYRLP